MPSCEAVKLTLPSLRASAASARARSASEYFRCLPRPATTTTPPRPVKPQEEAEDPEGAPDRRVLGKRHAPHLRLREPPGGWFRISAVRSVGYGADAGGAAEILRISNTRRLESRQGVDQGAAARVLDEDKALVAKAGDPVAAGMGRPGSACPQERGYRARRQGSMVAQQRQDTAFGRAQLEAGQADAGTVGVGAAVAGQQVSPARGDLLLAGGRARKVEGGGRAAAACALGFVVLAGGGGAPPPDDVAAPRERSEGARQFGRNPAVGEAARGQLAEQVEPGAGPFVAATRFHGREYTREGPAGRAARAGGRAGRARARRDEAAAGRGRGPG